MPKILVVDDERVMVKGIKFNLENEGYQVDTGSDGEEAVDKARTGQFDLIILDLMMPKIDGLQACMKIREFSNVPVIMLTAKGEDTDKIIGFECGADDYITKPFNILELKARIRALLRGRRPAAAGGGPAHPGGHHPGSQRAGGLAGRRAGGAHRQGIRPDGLADAEPGAGVQPGEPAQSGVGL